MSFPDHNTFDHSGMQVHTNHHGDVTGWSTDNAFGGHDRYDEQGNFLGGSTHIPGGGMEHHDAHFNYLGHTIPMGDGHTHFMDATGAMHHHTPDYFHSHAEIHNHFAGMRNDLLDKIR